MPIILGSIENNDLLLISEEISDVASIQENLSPLTRCSFLHDYAHDPSCRILLQATILS
jgi:hypothetical protein